MLAQPIDSTNNIIDTNLDNIEDVIGVVKMSEGFGDNSVMHEENAQTLSKKRKNFAIEDDFFALTLLPPKKKGNKHKKNKETRAKDILIEYEEATVTNSSDSNDPSQKNSLKLTEEIPKKTNFVDKELGELLSTSVLDDSDDDIVVLDTEDYTSKSGDPKSEANRKYHIHVISKIPVKSRTLSHRFTAIGSTSFENIIKDALTYFFKKSASSIDNFTLVWIEGKIELKSFFKPRMLGIPRVNSKRITEVNCLLIPKENASNFQNIYDEFRNLDKNDILDQLGLEVIDTTKTDDEVIILDSDVKMDEQSNGKYFNIGLKGKDNKRVTVQVSSSTKLKALLDHYLKIKNIKITDTKNAKLIFDDETLDLNCEVGDTELEEDFEVQIVI